MSDHFTDARELAIAALFAERDAVVAENQRLRDALARIADESHGHCATNFRDAIGIARAALAGTPGEDA
jgi:hypothetical protein